VKVLPNIKSAKKRVGVSAEYRLANMAKRSALKTSLKKAGSAIAAKDVKVAGVNLRNAIKTLDEAVSNGIIHKNQAARRKSRLTKKVNALGK
jgi:small subunit ribosomal protein S20